MISKNLRTALLVSLAAHVIGMSAVAIIYPEGKNRRCAYTRIDFLGAILKKASFDIMIENTAPFLRGTGGYMIQTKEKDYLENVRLPKQKPYVQKLPGRLDTVMDNAVKRFLIGDKAVPGFITDSRREKSLNRQTQLRNDGTGRKIIYRPDTFFVQYGLYGKKKLFKAKFKALMGTDGKIKRTELLTTTGYPQLDIKASRLIKDRLSPPKKNVLWKDEWCEIEVILNTIGG